MPVATARIVSWREEEDAVEAGADMEIWGEEGWKSKMTRQFVCHPQRRKGIFGRQPGGMAPG
jgi:hypothetical protein